MLCTPLEQFQIILLFSIKLFCFDFSITNLVLVNLLVLLFFGAIVMFFSSNVGSLKTSSFFSFQTPDRYWLKRYMKLHPNYYLITSTKTVKNIFLSFLLSLLLFYLAI